MNNQNIIETLQKFIDDSSYHMSTNDINILNAAINQIQVNKDIYDIIDKCNNSKSNNGIKRYPYGTAYRDIERILYRGINNEENIDTN